MHDHDFLCALMCMCVCVSVCMLLPIFTAGEDERTGVFVHGEIMELQLAFCVDGHPGERERNKDKDVQGSKHALDPSSLAPRSTRRERTVSIIASAALQHVKRWLQTRWCRITLGCLADV